MTPPRPRKRMGRPPVDVLRTEVLYVKLTPDESDRIRTAAMLDGAVKPHEFGEWVRRILLLAAAHGLLSDEEKDTDLY